VKRGKLAFQPSEKQKHQSFEEYGGNFSDFFSSFSPVFSLSLTSTTAMKQRATIP